MAHSPIDEVQRQHVFIEAWMAGDPVADTDWREFEESLDDSFAIVSPAGNEASRQHLLEGFSGACGVLPGVSIEIRNANVLHQLDGVAVVRYEEWQLHPTAGNQRISTVVFVEDQAAPLGWSWLALHETGFS
jgi:hypothetical protein